MPRTGARRALERLSTAMSTDRPVGLGALVRALKNEAPQAFSTAKRACCPG